MIYISVRDSGVGMSPEVLSKICKPYMTFNTNQMNCYGTGIGLYTSQIISSIIGPSEKLFLSSSEG